jgi:hypothetical protein
MYIAPLAALTDGRLSMAFPSVPTVVRRIRAPPGHGAHAGIPAADAYVPRPHGEQATAPAALVDPMGQAVSTPPAHWDPARHGAHTRLLLR